MENTKALVLVHSNMNATDITAPVDIILTPEFYTVKRESLPVQYTYQAKRIASSLFNGLLESTEGYEYFVSKDDDKWLFIAYNMEEIKKFLISKNINIEYISKVYFAEQMVESFNVPIVLDDKKALVNLNGTAVVVPLTALKDERTVSTVKKHNRPKSGISIGTSNSFLTTKQSLYLSLFFILFSFMFIIEGSRYGEDSHIIKKEMNLLLEKYPALQSTYTRKNISKKYKNIDQKERKKRNLVKIFSTMIFKGVKLVSLEMDNKKFHVVFACEDASIVKKLKELAQKEKFHVVLPVEKNNLQIEGVL